MIKKLIQVITLTLALNFLAIAGGVGWLWQGGRLGKAQVGAIREILFPAPAKPPVVALDDAPAATTQPMQKLEELLARASGRTAAEQVEFIQHSFDSQQSELDRRYRELQDLQRQVDLAKDQLAKDRLQHEVKEKKLTDLEKLQETLASDKGFQDSLLLYQTMPAKQVKTIFMGLDDPTMARYLQAMQPRTASKILKEFKTPDETARIQRVLEIMRQNQASAGS